LFSSVWLHSGKLLGGRDLFAALKKRRNEKKAKEMTHHWRLAKTQNA